MDDLIEKTTGWRTDKPIDYDPARHGLAVEEECVIQLGSGSKLEAQTASFGDTSLLRVRVGYRSLGTTVLNPAYVGFAMPVAWTGDYLINGTNAERSGIYLGANGCIHVRGDQRDTLGVVLARGRFTETLAALLGTEPTDLGQSDGQLMLPPALADSLRSKIGAIVAAGSNGTMLRSPADVSEEIYGLMLNALLTARPEVQASHGRIAAPQKIVSRAEEYFMEAGANKISLADLCMVAGASKSTLYKAFHQVCDVPPLEYFAKRRLTRAGLRLRETPPQRGAVKRIALESGFTELGRFAVEYRRLFGESPSVTLNSDAA